MKPQKYLPLIFLAAAIRLQAQSVESIAPELLWSGSWENTGNLTDRFQFKLNIPKPGLSFRLQLVDRRPASSWDILRDSFVTETKPPALTAISGGVYHNPTGSRLLYGITDAYGLAARIRSPWIRGAPYTEAHAPSSADLKTEPSSTGRPKAYLYLGTPYIQLQPAPETAVRGFTSLAVNAKGLPEGDLSSSESGGLIPEFTLGADLLLGKSMTRLEGFYTQMTLPPRSSSTWFSTAPALPERDFRLFGGSLLFNLPFFGLAADGAYSETFAYGGDFYGNVGLRLGDKPWRLSLAADGAGSRYVGSEGSVPGAGLRAAAKLERRGRGSSLLRAAFLVRGPGDMSFDRGEFSFYYRPPVSRSPLGITRVSLSLDRDSRKPEAVLDGAAVLTGIKLGPVSTVTEASVEGAWDSSASGEGWGFGEYRFESLKVRESLSWVIRSLPGIKSMPGGGLHFSARAGYTLSAGREPVWDGSLSAYIQGKWFTSKKTSRFSVKVASPDFPQKWEYTLSWRLHYY
jgi:hypothetical protein